MICDAASISVGPPPLATKTILTTYANNWYGIRPIWVPGKVAISYEGFAEWYIGWASGGRVGVKPADAFKMGGLPWDVPGNYLRASAALAVKGVTTPTSFISGSDGIALYHNEFMYGA